MKITELPKIFLGVSFWCDQDELERVLRHAGLHFVMWRDLLCIQVPDSKRLILPGKDKGLVLNSLSMIFPPEQSSTYPTPGEPEGVTYGAFHDWFAIHPVNPKGWHLTLKPSERADRLHGEGFVGDEGIFFEILEQDEGFRGFRYSIWRQEFSLRRCGEMPDYPEYSLFEITSKMEPVIRLNDAELEATGSASMAEAYLARVPERFRGTKLRYIVGQLVRNHIHRKTPEWVNRDAAEAEPLLHVRETALS